MIENSILLGSERERIPGICPELFRAESSDTFEEEFKCRDRCEGCSAIKMKERCEGDIKHPCLTPTPKLSLSPPLTCTEALASLPTRVLQTLSHL